MLTHMARIGGKRQDGFSASLASSPYPVRLLTHKRPACKALGICLQASGIVLDPLCPQTDRMQIFWYSSWGTFLKLPACVLVIIRTHPCSFLPEVPSVWNISSPPSIFFSPPHGIYSLPVFLENNPLPSKYSLGLFLDEILFWKYRSYTVCVLVRSPFLAYTTMAARGIFSWNK